MSMMKSRPFHALHVQLIPLLAGGLLLLTLCSTPTWSLPPYVGLEKILYKEGDDVVLLNATNFKSTIFGKSNAWVVQFYNSWCGHCIKFAPTYIDVAHSVRGWHSMIKIAAMNCADQVNLPTCREYETVHFPTVKFFGVDAKEGDLGKLQYFEKSSDDIQKTMVDFMYFYNGTIPSSWPILAPIKFRDMDSVWADKHIPKNQSEVAILLYKDAYLPYYVILDSLPLARYITVLYATVDRSPVIKSLGVKFTVPSLIIVNRNKHLTIFTHCGDRRDCYVKQIETFVKENINSQVTLSAEVSMVEIEEELSDSIITTPAPHVDSNRSDNDIELDLVYLQDLENVLYYILYQEVALQKTIDSHKMDSLRRFLNVLIKYLPARERVIAFLKNLLSWLNEQTSVTSQQLEAKIAEIKKSLSLTLRMEKWIGCRGSKLHFRGYPCGLWTTFHTLTVNAYVRHGKDSDYNPLEVTLAIRSYIMNFFGCQHCVQHFTQMSANVTAEIGSAADSVLWLWQAHNQVNARLKGDPSEDPNHPKKQFPTSDLCSDCRSEASGSSDEQGVAPQWDLNAVLDFLIRHYSGEGIVGWESTVPFAVLPTNNMVNYTDDRARQLDPSASAAAIVADYSNAVKLIPTNERVKSTEKSANAHQQQPSQSIFSKWGFGAADISICVLLYVSSIILLLVCYLFVLSRRRYNIAIKRKKRCCF